MQKLAEISIKNRVISWFMVVILTVGGYLSYQNLGKLEDPIFTIKDALVMTSYPGATAQEVEEEVTDELEKAIQQLSQLDKVTSISKKGQSIITLTIKDKYDGNALPQIWDELRRKVGDAESILPPGAQTPLVVDDFGDVYGMLYMVTGEGFSYKEMYDYVKLIQKQILLVEGVSKIDIAGNQPEVIYVEASREKMAALGYSFQDIKDTIGDQNIVRETGFLRVGTEYVGIRPTGDLKTVESISSLIVNSGGSDKLIRLSDIADIYRGYKEPSTFTTRSNDQKSISVAISAIPGVNVVEMGDRVKARLEELKEQLPVGLELVPVSLQGDSVVESIDNFLVNLVEAVIIVIIVLLIFMGLRCGLLIGTILLLTIAGSFIVMDIYDINLQRISLGALIIALGMLVDNAIVVTEGMLIKIQKGEDRLQAAKDIVGQTAMPLLGATVIAILAFAAIGVSKNSTGEYCQSLFQVLLISLLMSWVIAVTITPLFCYLFLSAGKEGEEAKDPYGGVIFTTYKLCLKFALRFRWPTVIVLVVMLVLACKGFLGLKGSFFPPSTRAQFMVHYWLKEGTDIRQTTEDIEEIERLMSKDKRVTNIAAYIGKGAPRFILTYSPEKNYDAYGLLLVSVDDWKNIDSMRLEYEKFFLEKYPRAQVKIKKFRLGPGRDNEIEARFSGPDSKVLRYLAHQAELIMHKDGGCTSIKTDWRQKVKEQVPVYSEKRGRIAGITRSQLTEAIRIAYNGETAGTFRENDEIIPIVFRSPEVERTDIDSLRDIQVWSPTANQSIPAQQVIERFDVGWRDPLVMRYDRLRTVTASCDAYSEYPSEVQKRIQPLIEELELPPGYKLEWGGEFEDSRDAKVALAKSIPGTIFMMFFIIVLLFNSIKKPLIIWLTVPLAVIGVTCGLIATNEPFGFMALLGFLSLTGMLIKNAIVLIDEIDLQLSEGKAPFKAIVESSVSRVRPVCMAAFTTVFGMLPLLIDPFFKGMAVTIAAGLSFATILTLIFVPVLYAMFFNIKYEK